MIRLFSVVLGGWSFLSPVPAGAYLDRPVASADACVSVSHSEGSNTRIVNHCEHRVFVAYCSTERPISGKRCGERADARNPFYTHLTTLEPGTTSTIGHPRAALRLAPCIGSAKNFSSGKDGNYACASPQPQQLAWAHGVARTSEEACQKARSMAPPSEIVNVPCECSSKPGGAMVHCAQALSLPLEQVRAQQSFVKDIRSWIRKQSEGAAEDCVVTRCSGAIGVRG